MTIHYTKRMKNFFAWFLLAAFATPAGAIPAQDLLDPQRIGWSEVQLEAKKFFISADVRVRPELVPTDSISQTLITPGEGNAVQPGEEMLQLRFATDGFGQKERAHDKCVACPIFSSTRGGT